MLLPHCTLSQVVTKQLGQSQHGQDDALAGHSIAWKRVDRVLVGQQGNRNDHIDNHEEAIIMIECKEGNGHDGGRRQILPKLIHLLLLLKMPILLFRLPLLKRHEFGFHLQHSNLKSKK